MTPEIPSIEALSSEVIDQIAAGEVVERPAHLVKELIENSFDAGATDVSVEVREGGRHIVVKDNGRGIVAKDLAKALERHTTSKIRKTDDLWGLSTYGFRGEALASIAAVSKLTLSSRVSSDENGARVESTFGRKSDIDRIGHTPGTRVQVSELFENVPARLKFMKTAAGETGAIRNVFKAMSLARPDVQMQFFNEGKLDLHYPATSGRRERAEQVLGVKLFEGRGARENVRAYSVMSDPNTTAKTSKNIWIFAQGRWIQDRGLQAAVMDAYRNLLMHGEYPFVVTWVETDPDRIDVNIHPTKSQVKFADSGLAFRAVAASVRDTLEKAPWVSDILGSAPAAPAVQVAEEPSPENMSFASREIETTQYQTKPSLSSLAAPRADFRREFAGQGVRETLQAAAASRSAASFPADVGSAKWSSLQVLGQADLTYLLCQKRDGLVIVDQHAAHERVLFEKIWKSWREGKVEVQEFLFPLGLDFSQEKKEALLTAVADLEKLGVLVEELGPLTIGIRAAPLWVKENALAKVMDLLATQILDNGGSFAFEKWLGDVAATMACHSAVRAGQALSFEEMQALLESMDEFPLSSFCPHGRPVSVEYPFAKLEKDFGRVLS